MTLMSCETWDAKFENLSSRFRLVLITL
jgi:hypothetical protein